MAAATSHGNTLRALGFLVLALVCGLSYGNALDAGFVYDDLVNITQRASLRWSELSLANWWSAVADSPSKRPVALATFGLQYWLGWDAARDFHAVNIAIHLLNGLLVWRLGVVLMRRAVALGESGNRGRLDDATLEVAALAAALVFVVHPIQTQSVTYIVQRMNALAATGQLAALLLYIAARRSVAPQRQVGLFVAAGFERERCDCTAYGVALRVVFRAGALTGVRAPQRGLLRCGRPPNGRCSLRVTRHRGL